MWHPRFQRRQQDIRHCAAPTMPRSQSISFAQSKRRCHLQKAIAIGADAKLPHGAD
jgi:hypothetical protein